MAIWVIIGIIAIGVAQNFFTPESAGQVSQSLMESQPIGAGIPGMAEQNQVIEILELVGNLNIPLILFSFIFYFLAGYLMYSSLLGAVGAAVDNEEDSQQLVFPITFPMILSIMLLFPVARNPEGTLAFWGSVIPFTSPIIMMVRIPYGLPVWELLLSMFLLVGATIGAIWIAAKIYKTGLLMYGKKVNLKELIKWLRYKH